MIKALIIISALISQDVKVDSLHFYNWWETTAYENSHDKLPSGVHSLPIPLNKAKLLKNIQTSLPEGCIKKYYVFYIIYKTSKNSIVIALSKDSSQKKSWLKVLPFDEWIPIDVYPFTSDCYGTNEVDFRMFWLTKESLPLLEITTNGPACVPMDLFKFDFKEKIYKRVKHLCGG